MKIHAVKLHACDDPSSIFHMERWRDRQIDEWMAFCQKYWDKKFFTNSFDKYDILLLVDSHN